MKNDSVSFRVRINSTLKMKLNRVQLQDITILRVELHGSRKSRAGVETVIFLHSFRFLEQE